MLRLVMTLGLVIALAAGPSSVLAQTPAPSAAGSAVFSAVDVSNFPEIHAYLVVQDEAGQHLAGLAPEAFALSENSAAVGGVAVLEAELGVQVVFVLDATTAFKTRDANGNSRLDYIRQALTDFLKTDFREVDDLSLLASEELQIAHVSAAAPVSDALNRYAPQFTGAADPWALLNSGLNFAADVPPRPGMRRVLVFLSNGLPATSALADAVARAQAAQVQIHTVFVGPDGALDTAGAQALRQLAAQTGGRDLFLQGPAALAPIFETLRQQRQQYRLTYRSRLNETGQHTLTARVQVAGGGSLTVPPTVFQLRVEPPVVSLPNLPASVSLAEVGLEYPLPVQVTFPDGHARRLQTTELLVDGQPVDTRPEENSAAVTWPLAGYTVSLTRTLQIRVIDELGLAAESRPAEVWVEALPALELTTAADVAADQVPGLTVWLLALAGVIVFAGVAGGGVLYWRRRTAARPPAVVGAGLPAPIFDPKVTLPLAPVTAGRRRPLPQLHFSRRNARPRQMGRAYLEIVEAGGGEAPREGIELGARLCIGRDPQLAEAVFPDRSVSRLHARIEEVRPGSFQIYDEGSTSGTWVNFNQVAGGGCPLQSGDLINLGRVQLRFKARLPAQAGHEG
ncbi:MAG: FHA domain-containing protein [Anaerolineales bacterium]|nr:FHA domain-containing protein [Anaerolineales bacterium]